ncbi:unnamed protein product, partial [Sphacelaria rigidula]
GYVTWTTAHGNFGALRDAHRGSLLRCLNKHTSSRSAPDCHMLPYHEALERTSCECIETTVMRRTLLHPGRVTRMRDERLPNIVMRGIMIGGQTRAGLPARRLPHC